MPQFKFYIHYVSLPANVLSFLIVTNTQEYYVCVKCTMFYLLFFTLMSLQLKEFTK